MTDTLLINFLFLLLPVLIFLIFFENKAHFHINKKLVFLLTSLSMILCMTFPIKLEIGFIFDLRYIPFIIISLFWGYKLAFPLWIVLNAYRFYIGGEGELLSLLFSTLVVLFVPLWSKKFNQLNSQRRILFTGMISFFIMVIYLITLSTFFPTLNKEFWIITFNVLTIHVGGTLIVMVLIQKIIHNVKVREKFHNMDRLNVISELAASISHEIRNPLTVTNGFLQLLNESKSMTQDNKRYIDFSLKELKRAESIVSDFLSLAKPQAENMVLSNLEDEFKYVNNIMIPYANLHQVDIQFHFNNTLVKRYDRNQIQQCLINLYKNGIESMKESNGTLTVDVFERKHEIVIEIKDNGIGMSKEEILRIGKPYYSTKDEGTGLGMIMVHSTISKLKGKIEVNSEKGKGTTFVITIPV